MQLFVVHAWACLRRVYLYLFSDSTELVVYAVSFVLI